MKKLISVILALILVFSFSISSFAEETEIINLGGIQVLMPDLTVEIKGSGYNATDISATLDSDKLDVLSAKKYENSAHSSCAYILVDLSTSMSGSFNLVKNNILSYIEGLSANDKVVLITFGEKDVNTVLDGSETREEAVSAVKKLRCNEGGTLFYEALSRAYQLSSSSISSFDREYVIAFSDGIDVQKGSTTFDEVLKLYDSHALPLYAACSSNTSKAASDKFGELSRASGGIFSIIGSENQFKTFMTELDDVTIVKLKGSSNYSDGKERQLTLKIGSSQVSYNVPITRSLADNVAPTVTSITYNAKKDVFVISFSEKVVGADSPNAYSIINSKGNKIGVTSVFYSVADDAYEIKTKEAVEKGAYVFDFSGITDASQEANAVVGKKTIRVSAANRRVNVPDWAMILIFVGVILIAGAVVLVIILYTKKNTPATVERPVPPPTYNQGQAHQYEYAGQGNDVVKHHIKNDSVRLRMWIKTGKSSEQNIETSIVSSLIVGRSGTCDIYIDDTKMSRQHFVIENDNGSFYIMDLQSRNGTMVNGIRISGRQQLNSGDKILAGLSDIIITILG